MDSCPEGANSSTSTSCTSMTPPPAKWKREHCKVQFQDEWLQEPEFKVWLEKCANTRKAKCALCKKVLSAHRGNLLRHRNSERHCRYEEITKHLISTEGYNVDGGYKNKKVLARIAEMRLYLKSTKKTCANWQPSKRALQLCNDDDMYKKETIPQHLTGIILPDEEETESDTDTDRNNSETHITNHIFTLQKEITKN
ncbi:uncharacterized protein LOC117220178 isoform X6 [Megalopta genalis]|uniref:uncharacterized protein LOC117220178 isoform X6 n=1 Tax=Megalopta genalis TaxID=115081 RepID=UPI003FD56EFE